MSELFGHGHIMQSLADGVKTGRLSHAYLFEGAEGIGKMTTVHRLSRLLMCKNGGDCGVCENCKKLAAGSHPDFIVADENFLQSDKVKTGSVEAMRMVRQSAYAKPFMSDWKLYVIPDADEMLAPAQNSLLKLLEEPPAYCVFLLHCENANQVLETVRTRSGLLRILPLDEEEMLRFLRTRYDEKTSALLLRPSGGIPGRALQIAEDEVFLERRERAAELFGNFFRQGDLLPLSSFFEKEKDVWEEVLEGLLDLTAEAAEGIACQKRMSGYAATLSKEVSLKGLLKLFSLIQETILKLRNNANFSLTMTAFLTECYAAGKEK